MPEKSAVFTINRQPFQRPFVTQKMLEDHRDLELAAWFATRAAIAENTKIEGMLAAGAEVEPGPLGFDRRLRSVLLNSLRDRYED